MFTVVTHAEEFMQKGDRGSPPAKGLVICPRGRPRRHQVLAPWPLLALTFWPLRSAPPTLQEREHHPSHRLFNHGHPHRRLHALGIFDCGQSSGYTFTPAIRSTILRAAWPEISACLPRAF